MISRSRCLLLALVTLTGGFAAMISCGNSSSPAPLNLSSVEVTPAFIPRGQYGRHRIRWMSPRYITIHSTQNYSFGADARTHARLLQTGGLTGINNSLGYLTWHFTVDESSVYQSLPTNEQGQHADYEGTGNRRSIGIEMCENAGSSQRATLDRTARLTAGLMKQYRIPLRNVVPHQHWNRIRYSDGKDMGRKNCPKFLLTNGQPGWKWQFFLQQVQQYL